MNAEAGIKRIVSFFDGRIRTGTRRMRSATTNRMDRAFCMKCAGREAIRALYARLADSASPSNSMRAV